MNPVVCVHTCTLTELSLLCEQRVKQIYENMEEETPYYFYMESGADVISVDYERSTWPMENSEPVHMQV